MSKQEQELKRTKKAEPRANLRAWRIYQGMTLQEVGDKMGIHRSQVSNWETGFRGMPEKKLLEYCDAIGIDIVDIYRLPEHESLDALLENATSEQRSKAIQIVKLLLKQE